MLFPQFFSVVSQEQLRIVATCILVLFFNIYPAHLCVHGRVRARWRAPFTSIKHVSTAQRCLILCHLLDLLLGEYSILFLTSGQ
jgi:hypothetical protein